jgi:glutathione-regulated potassium-efflux system ancillary protein KefG
MRKRILILFAHPRFERSANNLIMVKNIPAIPEITFHDLYEKYPDFNIDIESEKRLLSEHQIIVMQHPFYWYSSPPLLKQWIDLVLEFGWAYGPGGNALEGKIIFNAMTTGGQKSAYNSTGHNRYTINQLLTPFDQTAYLCKMVYLPPFVIHGTHRIAPDEKASLANDYHDILVRLASGEFNSDEIRKHEYLNDWIEVQKHKTTVK